MEVPLGTPWGLPWGSGLGAGAPYAVRWNLLACALCFRAVLLKALLLLLRRLLTRAGSSVYHDTGGAGAFTTGAGALTTGAEAFTAGAESLWLLDLIGLAASSTDRLHNSSKVTVA